MRCVLEANSFQTWKQWCLRRQKQIRRSHCCGAMDPSEERRSTVFVDKDSWWAVSSAIEFWDKADRLFPQAAPLAQSLQHFHLPIHSANSQTTFVSSNLTDYLVQVLVFSWISSSHCDTGLAWKGSWKLQTVLPGQTRLLKDIVHSAFLTWLFQKVQILTPLSLLIWFERAWKSFRNEQP